MRTPVLMLALLCNVTVFFAQDLLIKINGDTIQTKVLEIDIDLIKYKRFDNLEGPVISIKKDDVYKLVYRNGIEEEITSIKEETGDKTVSESEGGPTVTYSKVDESKGTTVTYSKVEYERSLYDQEIYNMLKINPLLIFNGLLPIYYEHRMGDQWTYEINAGFSVLDYLFEDVLIGTYSLADFNNQRRAKVGYTFGGALKFYPSNYTRALDEFYFGPEFSLRKYRTEFYKYDGEELVTPIDEKRTYTDVKIMFGYINYVSDEVCLDWYAGVGLRFINKIDADRIEPTPGDYTFVPVHTISQMPVFSAGFKIGFSIK